MIKILPNEIIPLICIYLNLDSKKSFREVNKLINSLTKNYIYAHIGNVIKYYTSGDLSNNDLELFLNYVDKIRLIKYLNNLISDHFFYKKNINFNRYKFYSYSNVKVGVVHRFASKTKEECIKKIQNEMCNIFDKRNNDDSDFNLKCRDSSLRRKLPLSYSLLLASSVKFKKIKF